MKGRSRSSMLTGCLVTACAVLLAFLPAVAEEHTVIRNGHFDSGLEDWNFTDASYPDGCAADPSSDASVQSGRAVIHTHSCMSVGRLEQARGVEENPTYFSADYELTGDCSRLSIILYYGDEEVFKFTTMRDSVVTANSETDILMYGEEKWTVAGQTLSPGTIGVAFDYNTGQALVYLNDELKVSIALSGNVLIDRVTLEGSHACNDGRDDGYAYFDNLVLNEVIGFCVGTTHTGSATSDGTPEGIGLFMTLVLVVVPLCAAGWVGTRRRGE